MPYFIFAMSFLAIHNLTINHNAPFSLQLNAGESVSIGGSSGCGKSLLLRAIADLDPHDGTISLNGVQQQDMEPWQWRQKVGLLPAESSWWHNWVGDHFREKNQLRPEEMKKLDLSPAILDNRINHLSSGERQRLALLRLLQIRPQLLLLDEPTANLDATNGTRVEEMIHLYQQKTNCAILMVSHDPAQRQRVANRHYQFRNQSFLEISL